MGIDLIALPERLGILLVLDSVFKSGTENELLGSEFLRRTRLSYPLCRGEGSARST